MVRLTGNADLSIAFADDNVTHIALASTGVIQEPGRPPTFTLRYSFELKNVP
jgi:hypothetical protein